MKFREAEELQVLNAQRQSGGERSVSTILYLVALQGDQRTDHDGRPLEQQRRHLVDRALARARRHDRERVAAGHDVLHGLELAGPELVPPEGLARGALQISRGLGRACVQGLLQTCGGTGLVPARGDRQPSARTNLWKRLTEPSLVRSW